MTTPHIEAAARAILSNDGWKEKAIDKMRDEQHVEWKEAVAIASIVWNLAAPTVELDDARETTLATQAAEIERLTNKNMGARADVISDAEIERVHGYANFGSMLKRQVVDIGVLQYAFGYTTGHTMMQILIEHGLIKKSRIGSYKSGLTKKGFRYLRAMQGSTSLHAIHELMDGAKP